MSAIEHWVKRQWITKQIGYNLIRREKESDPVKVETRLNACNTCKFNEDGMCKICKCIIEVKVTSRTSWNIEKRRVEITHCPKGLWPGEEEVTELYHTII